MKQADPRKTALRKIEKDASRPLRLLKELDPGSVLEKSPVELRSGRVVNDRDTGEIFLDLSFRSLSETPLLALRACVMLYREGLCIPYEKKEIVYSWESGTFGKRSLNGKTRAKREASRLRGIELGECFGDGVFMTLPDSYFVKLEILLIEVTEKGGKVRKIGEKVGGGTNFSSLSLELKDMYSRMNIFRDAEQVRPIRVLPKESENAWQCCCGRKNLNSMTHCEICGRDRKWQMEQLTVENLTKLKNQDDSDRTIRVLHDKSRYAPRTSESAADLAEKEKICKEVLQRVEAQEKEHDKQRTRLFVKCLLWFVVIYALAAIITLVIYLMELFGIGSGEQSAAAEAMIGILRMKNWFT